MMMSIMNGFRAQPFELQVILFVLKEKNMRNCIIGMGFMHHDIVKMIHYLHNSYFIGSNKTSPRQRKGNRNASSDTE